MKPRGPLLSFPAFIISFILHLTSSCLLTELLVLCLQKIIDKMLIVWDQEISLYPRGELSDRTPFDPSSTPTSQTKGEHSKEDRYLYVIVKFTHRNETDDL